MRTRTWSSQRLAAGCLAGWLMVLCTSCSEPQFRHLTIARRGNANISFINETPFRATFSFGLYDPEDQETVLQFDQLRLEGGDFSDVFELQCQRAISVGSQRLLNLATEQELEIEDQDAFTVGVSFSDTDPEDPLAGKATVGTAEPRTILIGIDYTCETFVIFTFRRDARAPGGFIIDLTTLR